MNKPMYNTVEDARKGILPGKIDSSKIALRSQNLNKLSVEEAQIEFEVAKIKLREILRHIQDS